MSALVEKLKGSKITAKDIFSIVYHDKFDYPLTLAELNRWKLGNYLIINSHHVARAKGKYIFIEGREELLIKRAFREKISLKKMRIARKAAKILSLIPSIKFVGITGSLAMLNADQDSDIDLFVITSKNTLWTTRLISYLILKIKKIKIREVGKSSQKDRLCLNMWLDEKSLTWKKRNIFTAHEIAQIMTLVNKDNTFEKFLEKNKWIKQYWPNALKISSETDIKILDRNTGLKHFMSQHLNILISTFIEPLAYYFQYFYMRRKITREQVGRGKAIFHPIDWSSFILNQLST